MKKCANKKCDIKGLQPLGDFARRPYTSDGHSSYCKKCECKRAKINYARKKEEDEFLKRLY